MEKVLYHVMVKCYVRGKTEDIKKLLEENTDLESRVYNLGEGISEIRLKGEDNGETENILKCYPALKWCAVIRAIHYDDGYLSKYCDYIVYSKPGAPGVTSKKEMESFFDADWAKNHNIFKSNSRCGMVLSVGEMGIYTYDFPFLDKWNAYDYEYDNEGTESNCIVFYDGRYRQLTDGPLFDIEDGKLVKYLDLDDTVVIPDNIREISYNAFDDCKNVNTVIIPGNYKSVCNGENDDNQSGLIIGSLTLEGLERLVISEGVEIIDCFINAKTVELPSTLKSINGSFGPKVENIIVPDNASFKYVDAMFVDEQIQTVYWAKKTIRKIAIPETVKEIRENAFRNSKSLISVKIPYGISRISCDCFAECINLKQIEGIENVTEIDSSAFENCIRLTYMGGLRRVTKIGFRAFANCKCLASVMDLMQLKEIGYEAFKNCANLKRIDLYETLERIDTNAFYGSGLEVLDIPKSVSIITDSWGWRDPIRKVIIRTDKPKLKHDLVEEAWEVYKENIFAIPHLVFPNALMKNIPRSIKMPCVIGYILTEVNVRDDIRESYIDYLKRNKWKIIEKIYDLEKPKRHYNNNGVDKAQVRKVFEFMLKNGILKPEELE